jgi:hypothetical protein
MPVRIIVCGGRDYADRAFVFQVLDKIHTLRGICEIIQGECPTGADRFAREWAINMGQEPTRCRAEWEKYGKRAGPIRNRQMLELKPDGVVAFDTGGPGTRDMITAAQEAGVPVYRPRPSGQPNPPTR